METSKPLAIESFSNSWLSDKREGSSLDALDEPPRTLDSNSHGETFDFKIFVTDHHPFHADELFSDGLIKTSFVLSPEAADNYSSNLELRVPVSGSAVDLSAPEADDVQSSVCRHRHFSLKSWRRSSEKILQKCMRICLKGLSTKLGYGRKSIRVDDIDTRVREVKSWHGTPAAVSPARSSTAYSTGEWIEFENPIYETVLHCKRSRGP